MFNDLHAEIRDYFGFSYPEEGCGLIIEKNDVPAFIRCPNVAEDKTRAFRIGTRETMLYQNPLAVVHSHADGLRCPSAEDIRGQNATGVPWGIWFVFENGSSGPLWFGDQVERPPLVGRGFRHGDTDCYGLIRDWYRVRRNATLPNHPREWDWWNAPDAVSLYEKYFGNDGFRRLAPNEPPELGDLALMAIRSRVINHAGVLCEPGLLLHHPGGRTEYEPDKLSRREPVGRWSRFIRYWIRYEKN